MPTPAPNLKDVARAAGLALSTTSQALRGTGNVSRATCERVREIADRMGYRPDLIASVLASRGARLRGGELQVAHIVGKEDPHAGHDEYHGELERSGARLGYRVHAVPLEQFRSPAQMRRVLLHRGYSGVFLSRFTAAECRRTESFGDIPVVICGRLRFQADYHMVRPNVYEAVCRSWDLLLKLGYRRIGAILCRHSPPVLDDRDREAALLVCAQHAGPSVTCLPPFLGAHGDGREMVEWTRKHRPDAVIAFGVFSYYALLSAGYRVPERLGFVALHRGYDFYAQPITGLEHDHAEIARTATELMDALVRRKAAGQPAVPHEILIPEKFYPGASVRETV